MPNSSTCGTNSTCLLAGILDALNDLNTSNNAFSWDLPSFIVTLVIGLLALLYALIPVTQSLLSSLAPQRYNESAIGLWSEKTKLRWLWGEMRFLAVVSTPMLDLASFVETCKRDKRIGYFKGWSVDVHRPYSGWLNLLRLLNPPDYIWNEVFAATIQTPADIIPTEFPAAYAYGTVETITLLAILAGCETIREKDAYPVLRGKNIQLEFRAHQTLGMVAAFTQINTERINTKVTIDTMSSLYPLEEQLIANFHNSSGRMKFNARVFVDNSGEALPELTEKFNDHDLECGWGVSPASHMEMFWPLIADVPVYSKVFPSRILTVHIFISFIAVQCPVWRKELADIDQFDVSLQKIPSRLDEFSKQFLGKGLVGYVEYEHILVSGERAHTPTYMDQLGDKSKANKLNEPLDQISWGLQDSKSSAYLQDNTADLRERRILSEERGKSSGDNDGPSKPNTPTAAGSSQDFPLENEQGSPFIKTWGADGPGGKDGAAIAYFLAFRTLLMGAFMALAVDNSDLIGLETMDQIVPFM